MPNDPKPLEVPCAFCDGTGDLNWRQETFEELWQCRPCPMCFERRRAALLKQATVVPVVITEIVEPKP